MVLSALTIFLSAFLLFQVQPMIAKMILPWFGGSAAVWITAMLFFQTMLLGGYLYAHWLVRSLAPPAQALVHAGLLAASLLLLPMTPSLSWKPSGSDDPVLLILALLAVSVGLPYFLLSTTSPLVLAWYARRRRTALPYRLFALSNFVSLLGLLAYPFLAEPKVSLRVQSLGWSDAFSGDSIPVHLITRQALELYPVRESRRLLSAVRIIPQIVVQSHNLISLETEVL